MNTEFDPYRKWLGIPPEFQPPNHYRLLGIELFEADADVIAHAADQRAVHLKTFAAGKNSAASQRLLNEVAAARICLLNAAHKAAYDERLRSEQPAAPSTASFPAVVLSEAPGTPGMRSGSSAKSSAKPPPKSSALKSTDKFKNPVVLVAGGATVLLAVMIVVAVFAFGGKSPDDKSPNDKSPDHKVLAAKPATPTDSPTDKPVHRPADSKTNPPSDRTNTTPPKPTAPPASERPATDPPATDPPTTDPPTTDPPTTDPPTTDPPTTDPPTTDPPTTDPPTTDPPTTDPIATDPAPTPAPSTSDPVKSDPSATDPPVEDPPARVPPPVRPTPSRPTRPTRPPMPTTPVAPLAKPPKIKPPTAEVAEKIEKELLDVYKDQIQKATTSEAKRSLAKDLSALADNSSRDRKQQFVVLNLAARFAAEGEDLDESQKLVDRLSSQFEVDGYRLKAAAISRMAKSSRLSPATNFKLLSTAQVLAEESRQAGSVGALIDLAEASSIAAKRAKARPNSDLDKLAKDKDLLALRDREELAGKAEDRLATEPGNAKANEVAGEWNCFVRGDWEKGLPQLAKSGNAELTALAAKETARPNAAGQVALGDDWWALSKDKSGIERTRIRGRAAHWYFKAAKSLTGIEQVKLLRDLDDRGLRVKPKALKFNGKDSAVGIKGFIYDGSYPITLEAVFQPAPSTDRDSERWVFGNYTFGSQSKGLSLRTYDQRCWISAGTGRSGSHSCYGHLPSTDRDHPAWVHAAAVYDGEGVRLYVNGRLGVTYNTPREACVPSPWPFVIGACYREMSGSKPPELHSYFAGLVRSVRVSCSVRYNNDFEPPAELQNEFTTVLLLNMSEGKGNVTKDVSGHKFTAGIVNAEWVELEPELRMPSVN